VGAGPETSAVQVMLLVQPTAASPIDVTATNSKQGGVQRGRCRLEKRFQLYGNKILKNL